MAPFGFMLSYHSGVVLCVCRDYFCLAHHIPWLNAWHGVGKEELLNK